jgi:class 3 adenylate cyclase/tetratricopeptide (TPR) repeat protein
VQTCPSCGEENPARFRLCGFCGASLAAALPPREVRKVVTIVFSDLQGSTSLGERLDSESLREVMTRYFDEMRRELERHGGRIEKFIGDAIMAVFGLPAVHEDDALRAVRAATGMQQALERLNDELEATWGVRLAARIGVNTGEVVAGDGATGQRLVTGDTVNTAARLEQAAPAREVLVGPLTYRLVRTAVEVEVVEPLELKGKAERVPAYRVRAIHAPTEVARRADAPIVGREAELRVLRGAFAGAAAERRLRMVTVIGDAGVGKSRLVREFLSSVEHDALVLHGRCLPYGEGITFWPVVEMVRVAARIRDDDSPEKARARLLRLVGDRSVAERVACAIGLSADQFPLSELFWGIRRLVEILGRRQAVVLVVDDVHSAETTLLDLLEALAGGDLAAPVVLLSTARHDILELRPTWGESVGGERIMLGPLAADDTAQIVAGMLGTGMLERDLLARVVRASEGNPLFVEQLLSMLIDDGAVRLDGDRWVPAHGIAALDVPPSIQALLAARLDRLVTDERAVVDTAAVIGLVFPDDAVAELVPDGLRAAVPEHLSTLDRRQLVHPEPAMAASERSHRFHHLLIRDAAYQGLLKRARATLHERFVAWADRVNADRDRALEFEEILGYHLEQAFRCLEELGPIDDHGRELGERASARLASAGRRASVRGDMPAAASLLPRAAALLPVDSPLRPVLLTEASEAMTEAGEWSAADEALGEAIERAARLGDASTETTARLARIYLRYVTAGSEPEETVVGHVQAAIPALEAAGNHGALMRAWRILTNVHFAGCRYLAAEEAAVRMIDQARLAGDRAMELRVLPALATCAQLGPMPVVEAIGVAERVLEELTDDRRSTAYTFRALANLEAMRGRSEVARDLYRRSRATLEDLGWRFDAALTSAIASGPVELLAGDPVAAEAELRRDYDALAAMGERNYISTTAAFLAESLYRQGRHEEADHFTRRSEEVAAPDDVGTQCLWRGVRAKVLARRRQWVEAESLAREGLAIIMAAQDPESQGNARLDLAEVLRLAGRHGDAIDAARQAGVSFAEKGDLASAARVQLFIDEFERTAPGSLPGRSSTTAPTGAHR